MWVSRSLENLSSRARAFLGRLRGVDSDYADESSDDGYLAIEAPRGLDNDDFDVMSVNTGAGHAEIFVTKPSEAAYFEHDEVFEPVMMGTARPDVEVDDIVEPLSRKDKIASGEPADLFINALRRPPYQKFDPSTPVIKKKVVAAPAPAPIEVEPVIEQIVFEADMAEVTPAIVAPEILAEDVNTVIEDVVIAEPATVAEAPAEERLEIPVINIPAPVAEEPDPVLMETLEVDDSRVECEISHEAMEQVVAEPAPVAQKFEIGDEVFDMSAIDFVEAPYTAPAAPVEKFEIGDEVFDMSALYFEEEAYVAPAPVVQKFEIGDEVFDMSALYFEEEAYVAPVAEAPVEKFEIGEEVFDMSALEFEEVAYTAPEAVSEVAPEAAPVAQPVLALPAPKTVVRSLPAKLDIAELEKEEPSSDVSGGVYTNVEMADTSGSAAEEKKVSENITIEQVATLPVVVVNEDRDVLFAFRNELEADEAEFISTSYDDNLAFREDYLDQTECTFKFRAKIERPRFDGNFRSLFAYQ